jgi:hypothetical protein
MTAASDTCWKTRLHSADPVGVCILAVGSDVMPISEGNQNRILGTYFWSRKEQQGSVLIPKLWLFSVVTNLFLT